MTELATFGAGGFRGLVMGLGLRQPVGSWHVGYMGGQVDDPTAELVATNTTGHAEVIQITYDPRQVSFAHLLLRFWQMHDPSAVPRNAPLAGHRFRSVVFFHSSEQEELLHAWLDKPLETLRGRVQSIDGFPDPPRPGAIVTEVTSAARFWPLPEPEQERLRVWAQEPRGGCAARALALSHGGPGISAPGYDPDIPPTFTGHIDRPRLSTLFDEQGHLAAALESMRRSVQCRPDTGRQIPVAHMSCGLTGWAADARLQWSWDDSDHTFVVNLEPGNYASRPHSEDLTQGRSWLSEARPDSSDPPMVAMIHGGSRPKARRRRQVAIGPWPTSAQARDEWFATVPDLALELDVGDSSRHRVSWRAGELSLDSHPGDYDRELALAALAGKRCPCLCLPLLWDPRWLRQRWYVESVVGQLLARFVGAAGGDRGQPTRAAHWDPDRRRQPLPELDWIPEVEGVDDVDWWPTYATRIAAYRNVMRRIELLPDELFQRWMLGALVALEERRDDLPYVERASLAALTLAPLRLAVSATLWQWCRADPTIVFGHMVCRLLERGERPRAEGFIDGDTAHVLAAVPFSWLTEVWARGLVMVDDHLVLAVEGPTDASELVATMVSWSQPSSERAARLVTRSATIQRDGDEWHLVGRPV